MNPDGKAVQRGLKQQAKRLSAEALTGLSEAEQAQMFALLQRVKQNLDTSPT